MNYSHLIVPFNSFTLSSGIHFHYVHMNDLSSLGEWGADTVCKGAALENASLPPCCQSLRRWDSGCLSF